MRQLWIFQLGAEAPVEGVPPWLTALLGSGTVGGMLSLVLYWVFTRMIPAFTAATDKQRADSIQVLEKQRQLDRDELQKQRMLDREENQKQRQMDREEQGKIRGEFIMTLEKIEARHIAELKEERTERKEDNRKIVEELGKQGQSRKEDNARLFEEISEQTRLLAKLAGNGLSPHAQRQIEGPEK